MPLPHTVEARTTGSSDGRVPTRRKMFPPDAVFRFVTAGGLCRRWEERAAEWRPHVCSRRVSRLGRNTTSIAMRLPRQLSARTLPAGGLDSSACYFLRQRR
ncbi:hypothetical protein MRX96_008920 [Rhipicephalus microplus]